MGVKVNIDGLLVLTVGAVAVAGYIYAKREDIKDGLQVINPASSENLLYSSITKGLSNVTGTPNYSLGDFIYDTRYVNPVAWVFEGVGRLTGDLP